MSFIRLKHNGPYIYLQEVESYRDKLGRPRQRYIRTVGKLNNPDWVEPRDEAQEREDRGLATAERQAAKIDAYQRATFGETGAERAAREVAAQAWEPMQEKFLEETSQPEVDSSKDQSGDSVK